MIEDFINQIAEIREKQDLKAGLMLREKISYNAKEAGRKWDAEGNPTKSENLDKAQSLNILVRTLDRVNTQIASSAPNPIIAGE